MRRVAASSFNSSIRNFKRTVRPSYLQLRNDVVVSCIRRTVWARLIIHKRSFFNLYEISSVKMKKINRAPTIASVYLRKMPALTKTSLLFRVYSLPGIITITVSRVVSFQVLVQRLLSQNTTVKRDFLKTAPKGWKHRRARARTREKSNDTIW